MADEHSSAASAMVTVDEPLSLDAQQLYQNVADADVTATTMFLASPQPPLASTQRYLGDLDAAEAELSDLRAAGGQNPAASAALGTLARDLPVYSGYVAEARSEYALGYPVTGGSFLQVASEEAHLDLLPAAKTVFDQRNDVLKAASGQATGLPLVIVALVLAIIIGIVLYRVQRWLTRRTNRVLNLGLALASLVLVISGVWLLAGFLAGRSDLNAGIAHGSQPAQELAQASIGVQQIRGDAVLNVISRSGDTSFQSDFTATSRNVGPGPNSLLSAAAAAQSDDGPAAALVAAAEREATTWYRANAGGVHPRRRRRVRERAGHGRRGRRQQLGGRVQRARARHHPGDRRRRQRLRVRRQQRVGRAQPARAGGAGRGAADGAVLRVGPVATAGGVPLT